MKKNSICKIIVSGLLAAVPLMGMAQQVCGNKPWSVRMAESEMVRCPESWQLDFQTRLKWDYCHGWNFKLCWMYMMHTVIKSFLIMLWLMLIQ